MSKNENGSTSKKRRAQDADSEQENDDRLESEQKRLVGLKDVMFSDLEKKLKEGDPATVQSLSSLYPKSTYPAVNESEHCVYCHNNFDPRLKEECTMNHETGELDIEYEGCGDFYVSAECFVCGESFAGSALKEHEVYDAVTGACYEGPYHCSNMNDRKARGWTGENKNNDLENCKVCKPIYSDDEDSDDESESS